jgi:hypothetical protein
MIERGAIVAVLAYLLEQSGRAVSITQYCSIENNNHSFTGSVVLKSADEPLDMDLLAFWLVCPDSFKRCWLRVIESLPNAQFLGVYNGNYGSTISNYGELESDMFVKGITNKNETWTRQDSMDWICSGLKNLKIDFNI